MRSSVPQKVLVAFIVGLGAFGIHTFALAAVPPAMSDAEILGIYIQVNGFDIETALLGRAQASNDAVRALAAQVAKDHMSVRQAAFDLATQCKVTPTLPSTRSAAASTHTLELSKLASLGGNEFDKAFVQHEVAFHRSAIDAVRGTLLPAASCSSLKAHFKDILPAFEHHLQETENVARELTAR